MLSSLLLRVCILIVSSAAQGFYDNWGLDTLLCNASTSDANATNSRTFEVTYPVADGSSDSPYVPDPTWAITVGQDANVTQTSIWYDSAGQNYSDDLSIKYDVCSFMFTGLPRNTIQLAQDDPGDCTSTFSSSCRDTLISTAEESAMRWTSYASPPPYSNLSAGVTGYICNQILNDLGGNSPGWVPKQCQTDTGGAGLTAGLYTLTGHNESVLNDNCSLAGSSGETFHRVSTRETAHSDQAYDDAIHEVYPILSVWFTVANVERTECCHPANSSLTCLRAKTIAEGSRISEALPAGTPYSYGPALSKGAIAGVAVGVVVVLASIVGAAWWFWRRRRSQQSPVAGGNVNRKAVAQADSSSLHELTAHDRKPELATGEVSELASHQDRKFELENREVVELPTQQKPSEMP